MSPSLVILGAGNMAYHLAIAFHKSGVNIRQVYNRSEKGLSEIEKLIHRPTTSSIKAIDKTADIYLISISDDAISNVVTQLEKYIPADSIICHTSGNYSIDVFQSNFNNYGAFYPLQSVRKGRDINFENVPIFISHNNSKTQSALTKLAASISKNVISILDQDRSKLHIPAVMVNNFVNHIYVLAFEFCKQEDIDFQHFMPLMKETFDRINDGGNPKDLQTGPAIRNDKKTIKRHRQMLKDDTDGLRFYNYITSHIQKYYSENRQGI